MSDAFFGLLLFLNNACSKLRKKLTKTFDAALDGKYLVYWGYG
jgi:hypothetical protein